MFNKIVKRFADYALTFLFVFVGVFLMVFFGKRFLLSKSRRAKSIPVLRIDLDIPEKEQEENAELEASVIEKARARRDAFLKLLVLLIVIFPMEGYSAEVKDYAKFKSDTLIGLDVQAKDVYWKLILVVDEGERYLLKYKGKTSHGGLLFVDVPLAKSRLSFSQKSVLEDLVEDTRFWVSAWGIVIIIILLL